MIVRQIARWTSSSPIAIGKLVAESGQEEKRSTKELFAEKWSTEEFHGKVVYRRPEKWSTEDRKVVYRRPEKWSTEDRKSGSGKVIWKSGQRRTARGKVVKEGLLAEKWSTEERFADGTIFGSLKVTVAKVQNQVSKSIIKNILDYTTVPIN